ncbi:MAG TPA: helix-turn-helix domain-containing protein [Miltoncostaeaceae bacterium]|nr:helix-turn-helix domain-containing protein [Miltoncostaeaceae bacterium]
MGYPEDVQITPGLRERKKAQTRRAISDVATRLFVERGFDAVTVAEVAEAAGVSIKTVFNYFGSKEELFLDREAEVRTAIVSAVAGRPEGQSVTGALTRLFTEHRVPGVEGWSELADPEQMAMFRRFLETLYASEGLRARLLLSGEPLGDELAAVIGRSGGRDPGDVEVRAFVAMLLAAMGLRHRAMVQGVLAGRPAAEVEADVRRAAITAFAAVARAFPELDRAASP